MYKKTKFRIVLTIMSILAALLISTLAAIYVSSFMEAQQKNEDMLNFYTKTYWEHGSPEGSLNELPPKSEHSNTDQSRFKLSFFYSVAYKADGTVITVDNEMTDYISDAYFIDLGRKLIQSGKATGTYDQWMYQIETNEGVTLVALKNNEILDEDMRTLLGKMIQFGFIAILLLTIPSMYLAHHIVLPLEVSYLKQKRFISDASHELKTPLTVIHTNAEMLESEIGDHKWLRYIRYEAQLMSQLVNQMLELTRSEQMDSVHELLDLSRLVEGCSLPFESLAFEKEKSLEMDIQPLLSMQGNVSQISNLVAILLDNALEYSPLHTTIQISLRSERQHALLVVSNALETDGKPDLNLMFDRFYRLDASRSTDGHFGLGLSIAKSVVKAHHGNISAYTKAQRLYITVELPCTSRDPKK